MEFGKSICIGSIRLTHRNETIPTIWPRLKWWWLGLGLLLMLAGWLYVRGYNVSLPYFDHVDEPLNMLEALHIVEYGHARGVSRESYPPGLRSVIYPFLKHVKPTDAHHGTMVPALRLITIGSWMLTVVMVALLGEMIAHPLTGLMAAAIWIVNPWVVERAHWVLPDGYVTLLTLLALWLALVGCLHGRQSFSTSATYTIMLAIAFKTQAIFVAPFVLLLPLTNLWRRPVLKDWAWKQAFWNCVRFAIFLAWLLILYPTLDAPREIDYFSVVELRIVVPSAHKVSRLLEEVLRTFQPLSSWLGAVLGGALLLWYRRRINGIAFGAVSVAALAWLLGSHILPTRGLQMRQFFGMGAMLAILFGTGLTGIMFFLESAIFRLPPSSPVSLFSLRYRSRLAILILTISYAICLLPSYIESEALTYNFTLNDRRNDLVHYMDSSLPPGKHITDSQGPNFKTLNRAWGGYDGVHDFPLSRRLRNLPDLPLAEWRANDTMYAILPYPIDVEDPDIYYPGETVLLKSYPPDRNFRGPSMVVLRLYPMQHRHGGQLGSIDLVGYDINRTQFAAGEDIRFRHYWQADSPTDSIHHVYNHLLDESGEIVAQVDYVPLWDDRRPTTSWDDPDEIMLGREFVLSLPPDLPPGSYQLISGLYDPDTWQRLSSPGGRDFLTIAQISVMGSES